MRTRIRKRIIRDILWGLVFVAVGVFIVFVALGYIQNIGASKIVFTAIFAGIMVTSIPYLNFGGIFFSAAALCIIYEDIWHIEKLTPWPVLGIALLMTIGFSLIFSPLKNRNRSYGFSFGKRGEDEDDVHTAHYNKETINNGVNNTVECRNRMASAIKYVKLDDLERAVLSNSFGEMKIYFDGSLIPSGHAELEVDNSFGEMSIFLPADWRVDFKNGVFAAEITEENRPSLNENSPEVVLTGNVRFGELRIIYV